MSQEKCEEEEYSQEECVYVPVSVVDRWVKTIDGDIKRLQDRRDVIKGIKVGTL